MRAQPEASHFVNGAYLEDETGSEIEVIYPATGEIIAILHEATPDVIEAAVSSAADAQREWAAQNAPPLDRLSRRRSDPGLWR
jgi:betaine-aldehyde dehydrogenase